MAEASQLPPFPPIDLNSYKWNQAEGDPSLWQRRACGVEALVGIEKNMAKGEYDLFYALTAELHDKKHTLGHVKTAARAAWRLLRYQQPQIACTAASDHQIKALLQYRVPKDDDEVMAWTERTVLVEASDRTPMEIRNANEEERKQKNLGASESATIYLAASVKDETTPLDATELRVLFRVNHVFFDGIGFRCMIACFFRGLAQQLSNNVAESNASLDWSTSAANLTPSYVNLLVPEQHISGPEYDSSLQQQAGELMRGVVSRTLLDGIYPLLTRCQGQLGPGAKKLFRRRCIQDALANLHQRGKPTASPSRQTTLGTGPHHHPPGHVGPAARSAENAPARPRSAE